jgi:hypothetical protein
MKQQLNARISEATRAKLDQLTEIYGTQSEVLAVAVERLWSGSRYNCQHPDDERRYTDDGKPWCGLCGRLEEEE